MDADGARAGDGGMLDFDCDAVLKSWEGRREERKEGRKEEEITQRCNSLRSRHWSFA